MLNMAKLENIQAQVILAKILAPVHQSDRAALRELAKDLQLEQWEIDRGVGMVLERICNVMDYLDSDEPLQEYLERIMARTGTSRKGGQDGF